MPVHSGGSARCYQAIFVPSTALASPGYDGQPAVYLYIAALEVNVLKCRDEERLLSASGIAETLRPAAVPYSRCPNRADELKLHVWRRPPQVRQANPADGCPPQFAHCLVSWEGEMPKMAASRSTSWVVNPRCLPLRRPSAAHTVELLGQPISSPTLA